MRKTFVGALLALPLLANGAAKANAESEEALAAENDEAAARPAPGNNPMEEVIVTARRREETVQEVPVAITALPAIELEARQVYAMDDLGAVVPNLQFDQAAPSSGSSSVGTIFIRGIGQTDYTPVTDPGVAVYLDGVYLGRTPGNVFDLIDVDRVEVLRGPQGTLFGRNSIGGAIKVHSARPGTDGFFGDARLRLGNDDLAALTLKANAPLGPNAAASFSIHRIKRDGYVTRVLDGVRTGGRDRWSVRASLVWDLSDTLSAFFVVDHTDVDENGAPIVSGGVNDRQAFATFGNGVLESCAAVGINPNFDGTAQGGPPTFPPPGVPSGAGPGCYGAASIPGPYVSEGTFPVASRVKTSGAALELDWSISDRWKMKSTTGLRSMRMVSSRDGDNTPANIFATRDDYDHEQFSQELQFEYGSSDGRVSTLFGLFYFDESGFNLVDVTLPTGAIQSGGYYDNESYAGFAHSTFDVTDRLAASVGLRHTEDRKGYLPDQFSLGDASGGSEPGFFPPTWPNFEGFYLAPTGPLAAGERILDFRRSEADFDRTDVLMDLRYRLTDRVLAYVNWSTGYKSGGFDQRFVGPTPDGLPSSYRPETVESFELGLKGYWPGSGLRVNLALFDADYEDLQIIVRESFNPLTVNAGAARIRGGELEVGWRPSLALDLSFSAGRLDASYSALNQAAQDSSVRLDNRLVNAPEWSLAAGAAYTANLGRMGRLTTRLDWSWQDEEFNDAVNSPQIRQPAYHLLHASLQLAATDDRWSVTLAARNLGDEVYLVAGNSAFETAASYVERVYGRPREVLLTLDYAF